jgi:hypothetical protein
MAIGFVVSFFDFRNDVRKVIEIISLNHKVVVFYKPADEVKVLSHKIDNAEYRPILEKNRKIRNLFAEQLFLFFKKLPKSRNNYFLMELFKLSNLKRQNAKRKAKFILKMQRVLPRLMSYDRLLVSLSPSRKTEINEVDRFVFFTEVADDYFLSRLLNEKKEIVTYVYSWDHPCKHTRFSKRVKYLCWSEGIRDDLVTLQELNPNHIEVIGASQFGYIYEFLHHESKQISRTYPFEYIYFGCSIGIKELVEKEISVIEQLALVTFKIKPGLKFVVRPYPNFENWSLFKHLKESANIILDDGFRNQDLSVNDDNIYSKFEKIWNAKAFLHLGTTMGLEASFTRTFSFLIDFGYDTRDNLSLYAFIHQYQNEKYLIKGHPLSKIQSTEEWEKLLEKDFSGCEDLNSSIKSQFGIDSFENISNALLEL